MKVRVIAAVLTVACVGAGGLVYWGSGQEIRLDPVVLPGDGVSQSTDELPVQVAEGDLLYRSWDGSAHVELASSDDTQLSAAALVRFADGDLLLTQDGVAVDEAGAGTDIAARQVLEAQSDQSYVAESAEVGHYDVLRLAQRRYFWAPEATVLVDGVEVGSTSQTQIAIDRTGAATLTGADNVRQRYLGHVQLVADAGHILDVSAEMFHVEDQAIDLTAFGGSDNEMLVLANGEPTPSATAEPTAEPTEEPTQEPTAEPTSGTDGDSGSADAPAGSTAGAGGDGSGGTGGTAPTGGSTGDGGSGIDEETLRRYEEMADQINQINAERQQTATPTATLTQVTAGASDVSATLTVADPSAALVGPVTVEVVDSSGTVVDSTTAPAGISAVQLGPLTPGATYTLRGSFTYDFGNGTGQQSGTVGSELTFTTLQVHALYTISDVKSASARVRVSLDTTVPTIAAAKLTIYRTGSFLGLSDGVVQEVALSAADLAAGGSSVLISGLDPETKYYTQAQIQLTPGGEWLTMANSPNLVTSAVTSLSASAAVSPVNTLAVDYDWSSEEYRMTDVEVRLSTPGLFGRSVAATVVAEGAGTIELLPESEGTYTGSVVVTAVNEAGEERQFSESLPAVTWTDGWALELTDTELVLTGPAGAADQEGVTVRFEQAALAANSAWTTVGELQPVAADQRTEARWVFPAEDLPFTSGSTFQAVVVRDGSDLLTISLSTEDSASEGTQS
ncbi:PT domain-containing protein [Cellulomonas sp. NPDC089187]|uniref:PT domain-containing protein n=1 Tax=Cellulomonas sp. NPDC089187 TaxID=3154970 RepID=UPI003418B308